MWWAVQTVTTVGYGDHVPETALGQILAAVVMLLGIGFVTVITASITGAFVARSRREQHLERPEPAPAAEQHSGRSSSASSGSRPRLSDRRSGHASRPA